MEDVYILGKKARHRLFSNEVNVTGEYTARRFPFIVHIHYNNTSFSYDIWYWWVDRWSTGQNGKAAKDGRATSLKKAIEEVEEFCTNLISELDWYHVNAVMRS